SEEGQAKLISAKESLLEHLKKEDELLYPVLRKEAEHNEKLKELLDVFAKDMENVSRVVMDFFDKYSEDVIDSAVTNEFEHLFAAFRNRIRHEEDLLYEEHEKINQE
ncbi:MAG: hemerythrin domain-containing protein, partial [Candidatus Pacebacteria bacterium]|nr:hemerythrin domain-containing protein [Candidatus Paceibacterota bacterium]